jgi:2-dehydropantoate 2-reductase
MKILMFGRGVISVLYGWALEKAGHHVEFYVRPGRAVQYGTAVRLEILDARRSINGKRVNESWAIRMREDLPTDHDYDLILLSVQHYHFEGAAAFLGPRAGGATVLVFNNLWVEPQQAASCLPALQLAWGFPGAGGGFGPDGALRGALLGKVTFGTFLTDPSPRELAVREVFTKAGFAIVEQRDFRSFLFVHFAFNCAVETEALKAGSMALAFASGRHRRDVILNMRELVQLLAARSVDLKDQSSKLVPLRLPTWLLGPMMGLAPKLFAPVRVLLDSHSNMEELRSTCRDVLIEARHLGVNLPRLEAASAFFQNTDQQQHAGFADVEYSGPLNSRAGSKPYGAQQN